MIYWEYALLLLLLASWWMMRFKLKTYTKPSALFLKVTLYHKITLTNKILSL